MLELLAGAVLLFCFVLLTYWQYQTVRLLLDIRRYLRLIEAAKTPAGRTGGDKAARDT